MNLSETVSKNFEKDEPKKCHAVIDLASDFSENELLEHINRYGSLEGILGEKISSLLEKQANGDKEKICKYAKNWQLPAQRATILLKSHAAVPIQKNSEISNL